MTSGLKKMFMIKSSSLVFTPLITIFQSLVNYIKLCVVCSFVGFNPNLNFTLKKIVRKN